MKLLLIAGVSGTGKTTIGNYLEKQYPFLHIDCERSRKREVEIFELSRKPIRERLKIMARESKPLTYYPDTFSRIEQSFLEILSKAELKNLFSKVSRVSKNSKWRQFKTKLKKALEVKGNQ